MEGSRKWTNWHTLKWEFPILSSATRNVRTLVGWGYRHVADGVRRAGPMFRWLCTCSRDDRGLSRRGRCHYVPVWDDVCCTRGLHALRVINYFTVKILAIQQPPKSIIQFTSQILFVPHLWAVKLRIDLLCCDFKGLYTLYQIFPVPEVIWYVQLKNWDGTCLCTHALLQYR